MTSPSPLGLRRPHQGSDHAWSGVSDAVYAYALARLGRKDIAEDIAQEAVARSIEYCRAHEVASLYALAYRIAGNLIVDQYRLDRRNGGEPSADWASEAPLPDQIVAGRLDVEQLAEALKDLSPLQREVFLRRRLHGQSSATIAKALNLTPKAIEKHITRALVALDKAMNRKTRKRNNGS